jgi:hypothetical protein
MLDPADCWAFGHHRFAALGLVGRELLSADPMQHDRPPGAGEVRTDHSQSITYRTSWTPCRCCLISDVENCQGHRALVRGARAQGQRRGPASRLSTPPPHATTEVRLRPPSSATLGRNGDTPLHTACSVRLKAFHIRQHRGHTRGHRPGRPRPRVASHGLYSLSRPSRVPSSRGMSERNLPSRSCRYRRPRSARTPAHRRDRLRCNLDRSRVPSRLLKGKAPPPRPGPVSRPPRQPSVGIQPPLGNVSGPLIV